MAGWDQFWHELAGISEHIARKVDAEPTGVTPGYNATLGGTVRPNGKLAYVGGGGVSLQAFAWECDNSAVSVKANFNDGNFTRIEWSTTYLYDPGSAVTTGSSWHFTTPAAGNYLVLCNLLVGTGGADATFALRVHFPATTQNWTIKEFVPSGKDGTLAFMGVHTCAGAGDIYASFCHVGAGANSYAPYGWIVIARL